MLSPSIPDHHALLTVIVLLAAARMNAVTPGLSHCVSVCIAALWSLRTWPVTLLHLVDDGGAPPRLETSVSGDARLSISC